MVHKQGMYGSQFYASCDVLLREVEYVRGLE
jgi:hypothetical protein